MSSNIKTTNMKVLSVEVKVQMYKTDLYLTLWKPRKPKLHLDPPKHTIYSFKNIVFGMHSDDNRYLASHWGCVTCHTYLLNGP